MSHKLDVTTKIASDQTTVGDMKTKDSIGDDGGCPKEEISSVS